MDKKHFQKLPITTKSVIAEATDELYELNASISALFCTRLHKPAYNHMDDINNKLGVIIKKLRSVQK